MSHPTIRRSHPGTCARLFVLLVLTAAQAGCDPAPPAATGHPIRITGAEYLGDFPTVIAGQQRLFQAQGLAPIINYEVSGRQALARLRRGETDVALMALTPLVFDRLADTTPSQGDDPVILANLASSTEIVRIATLADSRIKTPSDFPGANVAFPRGTNAEFAWWLFAHFHRFIPTDAEITDIEFPELADALARGDVDAAILWEPWPSRLEERLGADSLRYFDLSRIYVSKWVIVSTRDYLDAHPDAIEALLRGYQEAIRFIDHFPAQAQRTYADHTGINPETLKSRLDTLEYDLDLDWSIITDLKQQLEWTLQSYPRRSKEEVWVRDLIKAASLRSVNHSAVGIPANIEGPDS